MGCWPPYPAVVLRTVVLGAFALLFASTAAVEAATTFNWPGSWTAGSGTGIFTQSFTDGVAPNDITVTVDNTGAKTFNTGYPQISASPNTGGLTGVNALQLYVTSSPSNAVYIRTTVSFANPVVNLSFQLWDVDANPNQFIDKIANIQALAQGGGTVGATSVTSVNATYNTVSGTGLSIVVLGTANASNTTNQGSVNITFAGPITQFSFDWSNTASGLGAQAISLAPLTYTIVPEAQSLCSVTAACLAAILCGRLRKARNRQRQDSKF